MTSFPRISGLLCAALLTLAYARGESARFELRGILDFGGEQSFSLRDHATGAIQWLEVGRSIGGYQIEHYDADKKILTITSGEETLALALKVADGIPLEVIGQTTASEAEVPSPKRPPRPKLRRHMKVSQETDLAFVANPGALYLNEVRSDSDSTSNASTQASIVDGETPLTAERIVNAATGRVKGQLSYELKIRPPLRIESIGFRAESSN